MTYWSTIPVKSQEVFLPHFEITVSPVDSSVVWFPFFDASLHISFVPIFTSTRTKSNKFQGFCCTESVDRSSNVYYLYRCYTISTKSLGNASTEQHLFVFLVVLPTRDWMSWKIQKKLKWNISAILKHIVMCWVYSMQFAWVLLHNVLSNVCT